MSDTGSDVSPELAEQLEECQRRLGYRFQSLGLLISALTHSSGATHKLASNERLEFLGDAILGAIVCDLLFRRFPHLLEGDLTKIKSEVVSRRSCAVFTRQLALQKYLIVGKGMGSPERVPRSLLADLFESLVAAIYLDGGMEPAAQFVHQAIEPMLEQAAQEGSPDNYKSILQQRTQRDRGTTPVYELLGERGPDHAKSFQICAVIGSEAFSPAWGRNKKEAEQRAACNALAELHGQPAPFRDDETPVPGA